MSEALNNDQVQWTKPDGTVLVGPATPMMKQWWEAGREGTMTRVEPTTVTVGEWNPDTVSENWSNTVIDPAKAKKIEEKAQKIRDAGFAVPDTWYSPGTRMMQIGVDSYKRQYMEWADRLSGAEACRAVASRIEAEKRVDFVIPLNRLRMDDKGRIGRAEGPKRAIEMNTWPRFITAARSVLPGAARLLGILDAETRAYLWNKQIAKLPDTEQVKVGVRKGDGGEGDWQVFRLTGPNYAADGQGDMILKHIANVIDSLDGDYRGTVDYAPGDTRLRFEMAHMADPRELDPTVGDFFRYGFKGTTADGGVYGALTIDPFVGRIICVNCSTANGYAPGYRRTHRGSMSEVYGEIRNVASKAPQAMDGFTTDFQVLRDTGLDEMPWTKAIAITEKHADQIEDVPTAIRKLVAAGVIDVGVGHGAITQHLLDAHKAEVGTGSVADLINAVTRAAWQAPVPVLVRDQLENRAGELLPLFAKTIRENTALTM
jgi:hypothetical protein